jgi:hypothetical protein
MSSATRDVGALLHRAERQADGERRGHPEVCEEHAPVSSNASMTAGAAIAPCRACVGGRRFCEDFGAAGKPVSRVVPLLSAAAGLPGFWPTQQAQRLAGGKVLGELGANPQLQLNCYRWY